MINASFSVMSNLHMGFNYLFEKCFGISPPDESREVITDKMKDLKDKADTSESLLNVWIVFSVFIVTAYPLLLMASPIFYNFLLPTLSMMLTTGNLVFWYTNSCKFNLEKLETLKSFAEYNSLKREIAELEPQASPAPPLPSLESKQVPANPDVPPESQSSPEVNCIVRGTF